MRLVNPLLTYLRDTLRLSFCVAKLLPNKKWLSENYVAFARLVPFMYTIYFNNFCRPGSVIGRHGNLVRKLVNSFNVLLSILMRPNQNDITKGMVDDAVKIYLQCLNNVDNAIGSYLTANVGIWTKQNPLSLLNLAQQIHHFGPWRNYWEGRNEEKISQAKTHLKFTRVTLKFYQSKLERIRKKVAIDTIERQLRETVALDLNISEEDDSSASEGSSSSAMTSSCVDGIDENDSGDDEMEDDEDYEEEEQDRYIVDHQRGEWYRGYYKYRNEEILGDNLEKGNFVSCLLFQDGLWACLRSHGATHTKQMKLCQLHVGDESFECCGSSFFHVTVTDNIKMVSSGQAAIRNCLLMPFHKDGGQTLFSNKFTIISDEWDFINGTDLSIVYPTIEISFYHDDINSTEVEP